MNRFIRLLEGFLKNEKAILLTTLVSLSILYLNLTWKITGDINRCAIDLLFWVALLFLLWRQGDRLTFDSDHASTVLGLSLIFLVLVKCFSLFWFESLFLKLAPFITTLALALLASGFKGLRQYWRELLILCLMFLPVEGFKLWIERSFHLSLLTAKVSAYLLYYLGFNVTSQGQEILRSLPHAPPVQVWVGYTCTGILPILLLIKLSLLLEIIFPLKFGERIFIPIAATLFGFLLGALRVSVMVMVVSDQALFDYWHGPEGAQVFSSLSIVGFCWFCYSILWRSHSDTSRRMQCKKERNLKKPVGLSIYD